MKDDIYNCCPGLNLDVTLFSSYSISVLCNCLNDFIDGCSGSFNRPTDGRLQGLVISVGGPLRSLMLDVSPAR